MNLYKIEAGTAQHIGNRPRQNDRVAILTGARAPGYVLAVLSDGINGAAAAEQVLHTAKQVFDGFKPGDGPHPERLAQLLREIAEGQASAVTAGERPQGLSDDEIRERMSGNLCRCGAYQNIVAAIRSAAGS